MQFAMVCFLHIHVGFHYPFKDTIIAIYLFLSTRIKFQYNSHLSQMVSKMSHSFLHIDPPFVCGGGRCELIFILSVIIQKSFSLSIFISLSFILYFYLFCKCILNFLHQITNTEFLSISYDIFCMFKSSEYNEYVYI